MSAGGKRKGAGREPSETLTNKTMKTRKYVIQMKPFKGHFLIWMDVVEEETHTRLTDAKRALRAARKDAKEYVEPTSYRLVLRTEEILNH